MHRAVRGVRRPLATVSLYYRPGHACVGVVRRTVFPNPVFPAIVVRIDEEPTPFFLVEQPHCRGILRQRHRDKLRPVTRLSRVEYGILPACALSMTSVSRGSDLARRTLVDNVRPICTYLRLAVCYVLLLRERTRLSDLRTSIGDNPFAQPICRQGHLTVILRVCRTYSSRRDM